MTLPDDSDTNEQSEFDEFDEDAPIEIPTDLTNDLANFDENDFDDDFDDDFEEEVDGEYVLDEPGFGDSLGAGNSKLAAESDEEIDLENEQSTVARFDFVFEPAAERQRVSAAVDKSAPKID